MKLINADTLVHPDFSMQVMSIKEMLDLYADGCPEEMEAIPIEWIIKQIQEQSLGESKAYSKLLKLWESESNERPEVRS